MNPALKTLLTHVIQGQTTHMGSIDQIYKMPIYFISLVSLRQQWGLYTEYQIGMLSDKAVILGHVRNVNLNSRT